MKDGRERFTGTAGLYDRFRPTYPGAALAWLEEALEVGPGALVADVGCGTGILSRQLADRGLRVVGIDANRAMLEAGPRTPDVWRVRGAAEATGLAGGSVAGVVSAQAFHWFEPGPTLAEWRRILRPGGRAAAIWYVRDRTDPFAAGYDEVIHRHSAEYREVPKPLPTLEMLRERPELSAVRETTLPHVQVLDEDGLLGRVHSSSYVVDAVEDPEALDRDLRRLFACHERDGRVELPHEVVGISWMPG